jgi:hypothetical protein
MIDYLKQIVYNEGFNAYNDGIFILDCPYDGVSKELADIWETGWWDRYWGD